MRSEHGEGTGLTLATARPRFVMRMPSAGSPSNSCKHCSRKALTLSVFMLILSKQLYIPERLAPEDAYRYRGMAGGATPAAVRIGTHDAGWPYSTVPKPSLA